METSRMKRVAGLLFIATPILLNIPYAALIGTFDYPDILRQPAADVLVRFHAGGTSLVLTWWAFAMAGLPLLFAMVLLRRILERPGGPALETATVLGVAAAVLQVVGLLRWVFVVPVLASTYVDPASGPGEKEAAVVAFRAVHQFGGVLLGEHLGQLFTIAWMAMVSLALLASPAFRPWLGWLGLIASAVYLLAQAELFATVIPGFPVVEQAGLVGSLMWLGWMVALGVSLLRSRTEAPPADQAPVRSAA